MNEVNELMSESFESISELMDSHGMTLADLEYIVKYLINEKISPQLAMRRIKSFDTLKQKLEDTSDQDLIKNLQDQLNQKDQEFKDQMNKILAEKSSLENKKEELETITELFETERDELRNQLNMLQEMQTEDGNQQDSASDAIPNLIKEMINSVKPIINESSLSVPFSILLSSLETIANDQTLKFDKIQFESALNSVKISDNKPSQTKVQPAVDENQTTEKTTQSDDQKSKTPEPKKPKVDPQVLRILNLFLDFVREADNDKDFQNRIDTICEMDEAYEHLGSIGLSQLYSFVSKDLSKKEELMTLLETWKVEGVPR